MDPNLLVHVITKQAGTLAKALLEGVMNSVDAGAKEVSLTLTAEKFELHDDGRGFQSEQEIDLFFATFGTAHSDGDARFGRFRMGRSQLFAFGRTIWRSREFLMDVDIKARGLRFTLDKSQPSIEGCHITGTLYDPLSTAGNLLGVERELERNCRFLEIPFRINGRIVNEDPSAVAWDFVTDDAWVNLKSGGQRGIDVYQQGVYVEMIPATEYGLSGTIVTRPGRELDVNFARNQVLRSCPRFRKLLNLVATESKARLTRRSNDLSEAEVHAIWNQLAARDWGTLSISRTGEFYDPDADHKQALQSSRFLKDVTGRYWSPWGLRRAIRTFEPLPSLEMAYSVAPSRDQRGDMAMQRKLGIVFADDCFRALGGTLDRGLADMRWFNFYLWAEKVSLKFVPIAQLTTGLNTTLALVPDRQLKARERLIIDALSEFGFRAHDIKFRHRTLRVGKSECAAGWTDGASYIAIERKQLVGTITLTFFYRLCRLLLHEYCHNEDSGTRHDHPPEFYRLFHDLSECLGVGAENCLARYRRSLVIEGKKVLRARDEAVFQETQTRNENIVYREPTTTIR